MNRQLIKKYIDSQNIKIVTELDIENANIKYDLIKQNKKVRDIPGDEEMSRAFLLTRLVNELGYPADRIEIEHEYTAGRPHTNTSFIDVVVRDVKGNAFLFIEAKSPEAYATINKESVIEEQLYKVAFMEKAEGKDVQYLVLYTTSETNDNVKDECIIIDMKKYPTFSDWENERNSTNDLPERYGKAQKKPYAKDTDKDLETNFTSEMLSQLQDNLHDVLWGGGSTDDNEIFASLTNIILAKIHDEDTTDSGEQYKFQSLAYEKEDEEVFETNEQLFERINKLYRDALKAKLYILDENELSKSFVIDTKKFALSKLKYTVQKLEGLSFVDGKNSVNGKDILGDFFEGIIRNGFKQDKGQFFTHVNIVRFMLWAVQTDKLAIQRIKEDGAIPYMIDPSAGSGTFLIEYMKFITQNMKYRFRKELGTSRNVRDKIESEWFYPDNRENKWAKTYIYASESNFNLGTATKVNMILHGDGSTNIFVKDGLLPFTSYLKETEPNAMHDSKIDSLYKNKEINGNFDLILTNPPFSVDLDNDTKKTIKKSFLFGEKANSENLFIERWYQLLRPNGRLAAVLPESVLDTTQNKYIRLFIFKYFKIKAVISLPQITFEPYTPTKTSILFAQKKTQEEISAWNDLWENASQEYSKIRTRVSNLISVINGEKDIEKLPSIKDLSEEEKQKLLIDFLMNYTDENDKILSSVEILKKYQRELDALCTLDMDTVEEFGYVNTWWVFNKITNNYNYNIFMAEVDSVGFKRTLRNEKETENELFDIEYAPDYIETEKIINLFTERLNNTKQNINIENNKKDKKKDKLQKLLQTEQNIKNDIDFLNNFFTKYYSNNQLKSEFVERTDDELINEFKKGRLIKYRSNNIVLHKNTYHTVLDYMRDIEWDK